MILLGILTGLLILGIYLGNRDDWDGFFNWLLTGISGIGLFILLITLPINRLELNAEIVRYESFKQTIEKSREKGKVTEFERAAIQKDIVEWNQEIAEWKFYNQYWDLWIPDEFINLEPIE